MSIGQYVRAQTQYCQRDGWYEEICKVVGNGEFPNTLTIQNKNGKYYNISKNQITQVISAQPVVKYQIGDFVQAVTDYHWKDGDELTYCKVINYSVFANDVTYTLTNASNPSKVYTCDSKNIIKKVHLMTPRYQVGAKVSYDKHDGHSYYFDCVTVHGHIISIQPWYDCVQYIITLENGTSETINETSLRSYVPPAPKKDPYADIGFLQRERDRLMEQLQYVNDKIQNFH